jgi:dipeptide transport system substrate-binding protein
MPVQRPYNPNAKRIAELMQADLAKVGVKAEIKTFEWGEYRKRMQAGEHQMGMLGWTGDNGDPDNFLHTLLGCDASKNNGSTSPSSATSPSRTWSRRPRRSPSRPSATALYKPGAGDLQGAGALVHHRARGAAEAGAQGSDRLQAEPFGRHTFYGVDMK